MSAKNLHFLMAVAGQTAAIYIFLIVMIRFAGRRHLGQLSTLDLLILLLLGSAVETSMVQASTLMRAGIVSAITLFVLNKLLTVLMLRSPRLSNLVGSGPLLLVHNGHFVQENMKRLGMTEADVREALREREYYDLKGIRYAVFEPDGEIDVVHGHDSASDSDALKC